MQNDLASLAFGRWLSFFGTYHMPSKGLHFVLQVHGRSREQRYTKLADWQYIKSCVEAASPMPIFG
jgi:hypothetical protein